jgi:hypothetical protein
LNEKCVCRQICACIFAKNSHSTCGVTPDKIRKAATRCRENTKSSDSSMCAEKTFHLFSFFKKKFYFFRYCKVFCLHLRQKPSLFLLCLYFSVKKNTFFYFLSHLSRMHIFFPTLNENYFKFFTLFSFLSQVLYYRRIIEQKMHLQTDFARAFSRKTATRRAE